MMGERAASVVVITGVPVVVVLLPLSRSWVMTYVMVVLFGAGWMTTTVLAWQRRPR